MSRWEIIPPSGRQLARSKARVDNAFLAPASPGLRARAQRRSADGPRGEGGGASGARAQRPRRRPLPWRGRAARRTPQTGEVRWLLPLPPPPPLPRLVVRRKMADLEEQLSDEEKVRTVRAAEPVGPRASRPACQPGVRPPREALLCPRCPPSPSLRPSAWPCQSPAASGAGLCRPVRQAPFRACALKMGAGAHGGGARTLSLGGAASWAAGVRGNCHGCACRPAGGPRAVPSRRPGLTGRRKVKGKIV